MALTEKGRQALGYIQKYFSEGEFCAKELSDSCGVKVAPATLTAVANQGFLEKLGGSPVQYKVVDGFTELMETLEENKKSGATNTNLCNAKKAKNDEFYTRYEDIEAEVMKYRKQFQDKVVYLPCDDPAEKKSEFWSFFVANFESFGLKKLIATHYQENGQAYKIWIDRDNDLNGDGWIDDGDAIQEDLAGNGDFRSPECIEILKECDIVCTNPPFSLFREFVDAIMTHGKQCLIIGSQNAFTYKEIFKMIKNNKLWTGYNMVKEFNQPDGSIKKFGNVCWFTNLTTNKRNEEMVLTKNYNLIDYPKYENYEAIEVNRLVNIPKDYDGVMGVPITFIDKYNPEQFEILGHTSSSDKSPEVEALRTDPNHRNRGLINGKEKYDRILIRRKK